MLARSIGLTLVFTILPCAVVSGESAGGLQVAWKDRYLTVTGNFPGGAVKTHYLEAYCRPGSTDRDWGKTVIPHHSRLLKAEAGRYLEIEDRLQDGVIVHHTIRSTHDEVQFVVKAKNPTDRPSQAHWAQPCMRIDGFTGADPSLAREVYPPYIRKCFLMLDGQVTRLPTQPWALKARYVPGQVYAPSHVDRDDVNPRPLSELVPSSGLTGCYSSDETMILAVAWEPYQEIFQGVITCMHNDFRIGGLAPGETKVIRGRMYLVPASEEKLLARFRKDFPEQTKKQRVPTKKRRRIDRRLGGFRWRATFELASTSTSQESQESEEQHACGSRFWYGLLHEVLVEEGQRCVGTFASFEQNVFLNGKRRMALAEHDHV